MSSDRVVPAVDLSLSLSCKIQHYYSPLLQFFLLPYSLDLETIHLSIARSTFSLSQTADETCRGERHL